MKAIPGKNECKSGTHNLDWYDSYGQADLFGYDMICTKCGRKLTIEFIDDIAPNKDWREYDKN